MDYDLIIIGAGNGGYVAAIKAAQNDLKVLIVEKSELGGTCLNLGCIPSKSLLYSAEKYFETKYNLTKYGVSANGVSFSLDKIMKNKSSTIEDLRKGIALLLKKNKVTHIKGEAAFIDNKSIKVDNKVITGGKFIIATGSQPNTLSDIEVDGEFIIFSDHILSLSHVPKDINIIGGGYIGLEMAMLWSRLGAKVNVIDCADRIAMGADSDIAKELQKALEKEGIIFHLNCKILKCEKQKNSVRTILLSGSKEISLTTEKCLIAVGRKAYTKNLDLNKIGVEVDESGFVIVDNNFKAVENVYAIGDVIGGLMLAHKAEEEAIAVVENITIGAFHIDYSSIPSVIYTTPEVAFVGLTEEQAKEKNIDYRVGVFPMYANSRARISNMSTGFVKLIANSFDELIGAHIISYAAGEIITELTLGMQYKVASEDIARTPHPHPSFSESIREAAMSISSKAIHI